MAVMAFQMWLSFDQDDHRLAKLPIKSNVSLLTHLSWAKIVADDNLLKKNISMA